MPELYAARLDRWYVQPSQPAWVVGGEWLRLDDLAERILIVGGRAYRPPWAGLLEALRARLTPHSCWATAVTQGDVTEPNIAEPLCWLDFECAGRNVLAGDVANLIWYLLGMGGWLVPTYQAGTYARTLRHPQPPLVRPEIYRLREQGGRIELDYAWALGRGRRAALDALLRRLAGDLGAAITPGGDVTDALRPFVALRILGVIPLGQLSGADAMLCCAKLAEVLDSRRTVTELVQSAPASGRAPCPGS